MSKPDLTKKCDEQSCNSYKPNVVYNMAFVLFSSPDSSPASSEELSRLNESIILAQDKWNEITPGLSLRIKLYLINVSRFATTEPIRAVNTFYDYYPLENQNYDAIAFMDTWTNNDYYCSSNNFLKDDVDTLFGINNCSLRQVIFLTSIHNPCSAINNLDAYQIATIIIHETTHHWAVQLPVVFLDGNSSDTSSPASLLDSYKVHWSDYVNSSFDPLGGNLFELNNSTFTVVAHSLRLIWPNENDSKYTFDNMKRLDLELFMMGLKTREEVSNVRLMTNCNNYICSSYHDFSVDDILPINMATITPSLPGDTDGDGIYTWAELEGTLGYKSDPFNKDTNQNGIDDLSEILNGQNPLLCQ
jgi:hypothetical protein